MATKDAEGGLFLPPDSVYVTTLGPEAGRRNADGLTIPDHDGNFNTMVAVYKVLLGLQTAFLTLSILAVITGFFLMDQLMNATDMEFNSKQEEEVFKTVVKMLPVLLPILLVATLLGAGLLAVSWAGICTLRMKWLRIDMGVQIVCFVATVMQLFSIGLLGFVVLVWQAVQAALIFSIVKEIERENGARR